MTEQAVNRVEKIDGVVIGILTALDTSGCPLVAFAGNANELPIVAKTTVALEPGAIGREVALLFEAGNPDHPIIMGLIHNVALANDGDVNSPMANTTSYISREESSSESSLELHSSEGEQQEVSVDGQKLMIQAKEELVLKCGRASITLTRTGKVIIRGAYISTRSSGANRIKGGSVQIN